MKKNHHRRKKAPLTKGERETLALAAQRLLRSSIKSKAQVKRKGKGWKYKLRREERAKIRAIAPHEPWQWPSEVAEMRNAMADLAAMGERVIVDRYHAEVSRQITVIEPKTEKEIEKEKQRKKENRRGGTIDVAAMLIQMAENRIKNPDYDKNKNIETLLGEII